MLIYLIRGNSCFYPKWTSMQNRIPYKNNFEHKSLRSEDPEIFIHHYAISLLTFKSVLEKYNKILSPDIARKHIKKH